MGFGALLESSDSGIAISCSVLGDERLLASTTTENAFGVGSFLNWDESATVVPPAAISANIAFRRHNARAAVFYLDTSNKTLNFVESTSVSGLTWKPPEVVAFGIESDVFDFFQLGSALIAVFDDAPNARLSSATLE